VKLILGSGVPGAVFANPKESSKWDNWEYRRGFTAEQAKKERRAAEEATKDRPYRRIDDTLGGKKINYIE